MQQFFIQLNFLCQWSKKRCALGGQHIVFPISLLYRDKNLYTYYPRKCCGYLSPLGSHQNVDLLLHED